MTIDEIREYYRPFEKIIDQAVEQIREEHHANGVYIGKVWKSGPTYFVEWAPYEHSGRCLMHGFRQAETISWSVLKLKVKRSK